MKNIKTYLLFSLIVLLSGGCTSAFEEMNVNPNGPDDVSASTLLPRTIIETAKIQDLRPAGFFVQFFAQNNYIVEDRYRFPDNDMLSLWEGCYIRVLKNAKIIHEKSVYLENRNMEAVAEIISVNAYHTLTDVYGDIPYSEALLSNQGITNPKYDKQSDIYPDLLRRLESANDLLSSGNGKIDGDILFDGDVQKWKIYANSLSLRIAMRMSNVEPQKAREIIERILQNTSKYPVISSNSEDVRLKWLGVAPYREPWAQEYISGIDGSNHAVSQAMMTYLLSYEDPRLTTYARPTKADGSYVGAINGPVVGEEQNRDQVSRIGNFYTDDEAGYTKLITYSEICFIKA
ncbi:SusD/RagB family nutrient-binding outer membrane lipoprotein, partial [Parabacteroides sp. OttesenSCG-928-J18]|nr:SusD/RagB family nutrient-binding outer membrane lipoprotein [Parabacteroides sp. OttesenSCG-928-J18]